MTEKIRNLKSGNIEYVTPVVEFYEFASDSSIMAASFLPALKGDKTIEGYASGEVADDFWV